MRLQDELSRREQDLWCTPDLPDVERMEPNLQAKENPELEWAGRIMYNDEEEGVELTAGLSNDFSGKEEDATRWILSMKAYFIINGKTYDEKAQMLVKLNKMSAGRGATFTKGWHLRLANNNIPLEQKTFVKWDKDFHWTFIPKDLEDWAHQEVYSLSNTLQWGVSNQLAIMMTTTALPSGQEKTGWRWEQWLDKAGEFYRNIVQLQEIWRKDDSIIPRSPLQKWTPFWKRSLPQIWMQWMLTE